jgi:hypothetical protein
MRQLTRVSAAMARRLGCEIEDVQESAETTSYSSAISNSFFRKGFFPFLALFLAARTVTSIKSPPLSFGNRFTLFRGLLDARRLAICYGFKHIAITGPGLFAHEALSTSEFLPIEIVPLGQVTEAICSPALQASSHLSS